jgi:hypothetical protein
VCRKWRRSFTAFLADLGPCPGPLYTLDRYPNCDGHYEPGNVRWATWEQQRETQRYHEDIDAILALPIREEHARFLEPIQC